MAGHAPPAIRPRRFGHVPLAGPLQAQRFHGERSNQQFEPLPPPTGPYPYRLSLSEIVQMDAKDPLVFHTVGDTGGVKDPAPQMAVAAAMKGDLHGKGQAPSFLYHLGDVVYFFGQKSEYYAQFYEPYADYAIPIFAVPGNHDGDVPPGASDPSLAGFVENFCAADPHLTREAEEVDRHAMTQPNVYWTLLTPQATIIGLYSNVPEGGRIRTDQAAWLQHELEQADAKLPVILAVHHPVYSLDTVHGGNGQLQQVIDTAFEAAKRPADLVLSGHVHNYQRFVRTYQDREIPYVVAGGGGYHNLHRVPTAEGDMEPQDVRLDKFCDDKYGFLRLTVTASAIEAEYVAVARSGEVTRDLDQWSVDLATHRVSG